MIFAALLTSAAALCPAPLAIDDGAPRSWPCFFGPFHDATSLETDWSTEGQESPLWTCELGLGYSNVSIADGRLFTMGFDEATNVDRIYCLDPQDGEELWRREWPSQVLANFHGGGTLTTPSIDGEIVYVSTRHGLFFAFDAATGATLWERNYTDEFDLKVTFHGFSASPLVLDDRLILMLGGTVCAVNKTTGDLLWKTDDHGDGGYSNPVPFELDGALSIAAFLGDGFYVYTAETGDEIYRFPWKSDAGGVNACIPIVMGRRIFISTAYGLGSAMIELGDDPIPTEIWRARRMRNKVSSCVLLDGHIYGFDESMLKCLDLEGNELWYKRGLGMGSVALAGDRLIVLSSKGELIIAKASPNGFEPIVRRPLLEGGVYWTTPVLLNGLLYCRNSLGHLVCLDHRGDQGTGDNTLSGPADATGMDLPSADSLFEGHARSVGGERLASHFSATLKGTIAILGDGITETSMTIEVRPDRWKMEYDLGRYGTVYHGFDGTVGWMLDPFYGDKLMTASNLRQLQETSLLHAPLEWRAIYEDLSTTGQTTFQNRPCFVVLAQSKSGVARRFYFDAESRDLIGHDGDGEALVHYEQWAAFGEVQLPARFTKILPDTGAEETYTITDVTWNDVADDAFDHPAPVRELLRTPEEVVAENARAKERFARYLGSFSGVPESDAITWTIGVEKGKLSAASDRMSTQLLIESDTPGLFYFPGSKDYMLVFPTERSDEEAPSFTFERPEGAVVFTRS